MPTLSAVYSCQARLTDGDISEQRQLERDELFPLFRKQADLVGPLAVGWGYPPPLIEKVTWGRTVAAARQIRSELCRAWRPESATLREALRVAFLIDLSTTSAVESIEFLFDTLGPKELTEGGEVDDASEFLGEAWRQVGRDLFDQDWLRLCVREPSYEPTCVPAVIVASWVCLHRQDLITTIEDQAAQRIPDANSTTTDLWFELGDLSASPAWAAR